MPEDDFYANLEDESDDDEWGDLSGAFGGPLLATPPTNALADSEDTVDSDFDIDEGEYNEEEEGKKAEQAARAKEKMTTRSKTLTYIDPAKAAKKRAKAAKVAASTVKSTTDHSPGLDPFMLLHLGFLSSLGFLSVSFLSSCGAMAAFHRHATDERRSRLPQGNAVAKEGRRGVGYAAQQAAKELAYSLRAVLQAACAEADPRGDSESTHLLSTCSLACPALALVALFG